MEAVSKQSKLRRDPADDIRILSEYAMAQQVETSETQKQIKLDNTFPVTPTTMERKMM